MMHCHNLVHEDHDMMGQFWVGGPAGRVSGDTLPTDDPHHPMNAAPAKRWTGEYAGRPDTDGFKGF